MFADVRCPEKLKPQELDDYLSGGWFRMGQTIFTTNFLNFKDHIYSAIWLRIVLDNFEGDSTQEKLFKKNAGFRTEVGPAELTPEKEALFMRYRESVTFEPSPSLNHLLYGKSLHPTIFDTYEISVYDGDKLIALGFFDMGEISAEGIISIYDPDYKKFSLGRFLIYQKIHHCKQAGVRHFYPGYFVPGYPYFDYKLAIAHTALEYLQLSSDHWCPIDDFKPGDNIPVEVMQSRLLALQRIMVELDIPCRVFQYAYFDANQMPDLMGAELFDYPIFLFCHHEIDDNLGSFVVYDVRDGLFHWIKCMSAWTPETMPQVPDNFYCRHLLKTLFDLFSTDDPLKMASALVNG
jgi:leucyl-tRNA---protein transferase